MQLAAYAGPCIECYRTGETVAVPSLFEAREWGDFRSEALGLGFASIYALPLRLREQTACVPPVQPHEAVRASGSLLAGDVASAVVGVGADCVGPVRCCRCC